MVNSWLLKFRRFPSSSVICKSIPSIFLTFNKWFTFVVLEWVTNPNTGSLIYTVASIDCVCVLLFIVFRATVARLCDDIVIRFVPSKFNGKGETRTLLMLDVLLDDKNPNILNIDELLLNVKLLVDVYVILPVIREIIGIMLWPFAKNNVVIVESDNIQTANFNLKGMTCESCESAVNSELSKVNGVIETKTSYAKGTTTIKFDKSKTSIEQLKKAISQTGYKLTNYELLNK